MAEMGSSNITKACKPMLAPSHERDIRGYHRLHTQEAKYTGIALERQRDGIEIWHRLLSLLDDAVRGEHQSPAHPGTHEHDSWELRLRIAVTEVNTAKLALDAALAGYHVQSLGLIRRMLESWRLMVFARIRVDLAKLWLEPVQKGKYDTLGEGKIKRQVEKHASKNDKSLLHNAITVNSLIVQCHKGTHPSELGFEPMETGNSEHQHVGATYTERRLKGGLSFGMASIGLIIDEVRRDVHISEEWANEFNEVANLTRQWHDQTQ